MALMSAIARTTFARLIAIVIFGVASAVSTEIVAMTDTSSIRVKPDWAVGRANRARRTRGRKHDQLIWQNSGQSGVGPALTPPHPQNGDRWPCGTRSDVCHG